MREWRSKAWSLIASWTVKHEEYEFWAVKSWDEISKCVWDSFILNLNQLDK